MTEEDDEILSAELVFSTQEIIDEYFRKCEEAAAEYRMITADDAKDLRRALDRDYRSRLQKQTNRFDRSS